MRQSPPWFTILMGAVLWSSTLSFSLIAGSGSASDDAFPDARACLMLSRDSGLPESRGNYVAREGETPVADRLPQVTFDKALTVNGEAIGMEQKGESMPAAKKLLEGMEALPEPRAQWKAFTFILVRVGDIYFKAKKFETAARCLDDAMYGPGAIGNPFIHLRSGQVQFELGDMRRAGDELSRAYMGGGRDIFRGEDPKYFGLVEKLLQPSPGETKLR